MEDKVSFYKYPEILMCATGYVHHVTGELIELTANEKNVYLVMKKRNTFFDKHFDKQEDIADLCGVGLKQTGRILRSFIENGVIVAHKGVGNQHKNWRYESVLDIELYKIKDGKVEVLGKIGEDFWKTEKKPTRKVAEWKGVNTEPQSHTNTHQRQQPTPYWVDDEGGPF